MNIKFPAYCHVTCHDCRTFSVAFLTGGGGDGIRGQDGDLRGARTRGRDSGNIQEKLRRTRDRIYVGWSVNRECH